MTRAGLRSRALFRWLGVSSALTMLGVVAWLVVDARSAQPSHHSDVNKDGLVDSRDVELFAQEALGSDWWTVDWCQWAADPGKYYAKHASDLVAFVVAYFRCDPLRVVRQNEYPTRLAWGPGGRLYVSDAKVGSVFIYERSPQLTLIGELKHLDTPLAVAVDSMGLLYVGSDGRDRVEVYDPNTGVRLTTVGDGMLQMPNGLAIDPVAGDLYVADSRSDRVWVFNPATGELLGAVGEGLLRFPVGLAIAGSELYVADQGNNTVQVFDLQGNHVRSLGQPVAGGFTFSYQWQGRFVRLQSVAVDGLGRVHALDSHMGRIQLLDAWTGTFLGYYGEHGTQAGQLSLPLDLALSADETEAAVANALHQRAELLPVP